jgi:hypothetical protein
MQERERPAERRDTVRVLFGTLNLVAALVTVIGVFQALPTRWLPVDLPAGIVALLLAAAGGGLLSRAPWGLRVARIASMVTLGAGLLLVALLVFTASYLNGIYGPVGHGGALILILVAALALPYLVAFPASQLLWLGPRGRAAAGPRLAADARTEETRAP